MFEELNDKQKQAVFTTNHKVLVMAGAGTGKTKVLTNRIMKLLEDDINPNSIIAFTFTNKASKEMKERIRKKMNNISRRREKNKESKIISREKINLITRRNK